MSDSEYVNVYTGTEVNIQYLQSVLDKAGVSSIVKNNHESGIRSGFYGGDAMQVQLLVHVTHQPEAEKIVKATFDN